MLSLFVFCLKLLGSEETRARQGKTTGTERSGDRKAAQGARVRGPGGGGERELVAVRCRLDICLLAYTKGAGGGEGRRGSECAPPEPALPHTNLNAQPCTLPWAPVSEASTPGPPTWEAGGTLEATGSAGMFLPCSICRPDGGIGWRRRSRGGLGALGLFGLFGIVRKATAQGSAVRRHRA